MLRSRVLVSAAAACLVLVGAPGATANAPASTYPIALDPQEDCPNDGLGDLAPDPVAVVPSDARVTLGVLVLLDGITVSQAKALVRRAQASYDPLNITLAARFENVTIRSDGKAADGQPTAGKDYLLASMRRIHPTLPAGIDVAHLLTAKDIVETTNPDRAGTDELGGYSACVGGIRYAGQQYSMSEAKFRFASQNGPEDDFHSIAMAHEIGHLLGAHHHYGNCAEGRTHTPGGQGSCTVMFPVASLDSARFGSLEASVIRSYAEAYAD
jgi:hypothetical protein